jgi:hypothetical protein
MAKAVDDGSIKCFNLLEGLADGDLNLWIREVMPCFLDGNATPTIPHKYSKNMPVSSCFPAGCADTAAEDGRRGSNVYEANTWQWMFGRGKHRLGGLTIEET